MEIAHELLHSEEFRYSKGYLSYLQVLFQSLLYLTKFLNVAMVQNFEVMLGQTLNHSA
jgi:hypothetical protein